MLAEREGANCIILDPSPLNATLTFYCIFMNMFMREGGHNHESFKLIIVQE